MEANQLYSKIKQTIDQQLVKINKNSPSHSHSHSHKIYSLNTQCDNPKKISQQRNQFYEVPERNKHKQDLIRIKDTQIDQYIKKQLDYQKQIQNYIKCNQKLKQQCQDLKNSKQILLANIKVLQNELKITRNKSDTEQRQQKNIISLSIENHNLRQQLKKLKEQRQIQSVQIKKLQNLNSQLKENDKKINQKLIYFENQLKNQIIINQKIQKDSKKVLKFVFAVQTLLENMNWVDQQLNLKRNWRILKQKMHDYIQHKNAIDELKLTQKYQSNSKMNKKLMNLLQKKNENQLISHKSMEVSKNYFLKNYYD